MFVFGQRQGPVSTLPAQATGRNTPVRFGLRSSVGQSGPYVVILYFVCGQEPLEAVPGPAARVRGRLPRRRGFSSGRGRRGDLRSSPSCLWVLVMSGGSYRASEVPRRPRSAISRAVRWQVGAFARILFAGSIADGAVNTPSRSFATALGPPSEGLSPPTPPGSAGGVRSRSALGGLPVVWSPPRGAGGPWGKLSPVFSLTSMLLWVAPGPAAALVTGRRRSPWRGRGGTVRSPPRGFTGLTWSVVSISIAAPSSSPFNCGHGVLKRSGRFKPSRGLGA
jgi:hypothetical protein